MLFLSCLYGCPHRQSYLMMTSYWSMWDPRWLPWRTPPLPTTIHRLQLPSLLSDGGKPCWGREARARARCSSLPWRPRGGDRSQDTRLSCCTNTGMSIRPEEQDRDFRWSRHQRGWQGPDSRAVELLNKIWEEDKTIGDVLAVSCPDWWCSKVTAGGLSSPNLWKVGTHRCLEFLSDLLVNIQESEWLRSIQVTTPDWRQDSESLTEGRKKKNKQDLIFTLNTTLNIKNQLIKTDFRELIYDPFINKIYVLIHLKSPAEKELPGHRLCLCELLLPVRHRRRRRRLCSLRKQWTDVVHSQVAQCHHAACSLHQKNTHDIGL